MFLSLSESSSVVSESSFSWSKKKRESEREGTCNLTTNRDLTLLTWQFWHLKKIKNKKIAWKLASRVMLVSDMTTEIPAAVMAS